MNLSKYRKLFKSKDSTPGWDAIDSALKQIYKKKKSANKSAKSEAQKACAGLFGVSRQRNFL